MKRKPGTKAAGFVATKALFQKASLHIRFIGLMAILTLGSVKASAAQIPYETNLFQVISYDECTGTLVFEFMSSGRNDANTERARIKEGSLYFRDQNGAYKRLLYMADDASRRPAGYQAAVTTDLTQVFYDPNASGPQISFSTINYKERYYKVKVTWVNAYQYLNQNSPDLELDVPGWYRDTDQGGYWGGASYAGVQNVVSSVDIATHQFESAEVVSCGSSLHLKWAEPDYACNYVIKIFRNGGWYTDVTEGVEEYFDTEVTPGQTYDYDLVFQNTETGWNIASEFLQATSGEMIDAPEIDEPMVSDDDASITIRWTPPVVDGCDDYFYRLTRTSLLNGAVRTFDVGVGEILKPEQYVDVSVNSCESYQYQVQVISGEDIENVSSATVVARYPKIQPAPGGVVISSGKCDGTIDIGWDWFVENPSGFVIERSEASDFSNPVTVTSDLSGSKRSFTDNTVTKGVTYYYQVLTKDACGTVSEVRGDTEAGIAPNQPTAATDVAVSVESEGVRITWTNNSSNEEEIRLIRYQNGGGVSEFILDPGTSTYIDADAKTCEAYAYKVVHINDCGTVESTKSEPVSVLVDLSVAFEVDFLETSKGYFSDRVELNWTVQEVDTYVDYYKIYRRKLGSSIMPGLLGTFNGETRSYDDPRIDAGVLYEYFIIAESDCGLDNLVSYDINNLSGQDYQSWAAPASGVAYAVGFRSPLAVVNGNISYSGGVSVPDVKVVAERETGVTGYSLHFDGNDRLAIPHSTSLEFEDQFTGSLWFKADEGDESQDLIYKNGLWEVNLNAGNLTVNLNNGSWQQLTAEEAISAGNYYNVTVTYDGAEAILYISGREMDRIAMTGNLQGHGSELIFGGYSNDSYNYSGYLDEVRLHAQAMDSITVARTFGRSLSKEEYSLRAYWRMNEGVGPFLFDASSNGGIYNKNDGSIGGAEWSEDVPASTQLGYSGYTNASGNYTISGIFYSGTGENFTITPTVTMAGVVHEFDPGNQVVYLGEGNSVQNGVDFDDISSFTVTGRVVYGFQNDDVGAADVTLKIDGLPVSNNSGQLVKTDANGEFTINVPIGKHVISVQNADHVFEGGGYWPSENTTHDFQDDVSGLVFYDKTVRKLAGRVVGGTREGDKPVGFDKSLNNIGQAQFRLVSLDGLIDVPVSTDVSSGEYEVELPPIAYQIKTVSDNTIGIDIINNPAVDFSGIENVDLTTAFVELTDRDTTYNDDGSVDEVREYGYHLKKNFIYRVVPEIEVLNADEGMEGATVFGDQVFTFTNPETSEEDQVLLIDNDAYTLGRPVFTRAKEYKLRIKVYETFTNFDQVPPAKDIVPVTDARIEITNNIAEGYYYDERGQKKNYSGRNVGLDVIDLKRPTGDTVYYISPLEPNLSIDLADPSKSYTKSMIINVTAAGNSVQWPVSGEPMRAYVLGAKATSQNFITRSPDLVDFVLRDPPGSNSYSYIAEGTSKTKTTAFGFGAGLDIDIEAGIGVGSNTLVGGGICGVGEIQEIYLAATVGASISTSVNQQNELVETYEFTQTIETNANNETVGAAGDLFVGKSVNYLYGISDNLVMVPTSTCASPEVFCICEIADQEPSVSSEDVCISDAEGAADTYTLARKVGFFLVPNGDPTYFIYSQNHIENYLIPDLVSLRNSILTNNPNYQNHAPAAFFGTNNDDPVWGAAVTSPDPLGTQDEDFDGPSYTFLAAVDGDPSNDTEIDSIRWFNQQIRLWQQALADNEREKIEAFESGVKDNFSISGGSSISQEKTSTSSKAHGVEFDLSASLSIGLETEFDGWGFGFRLYQKNTVTMNTNVSYNEENAETTTYGFTLDEPDVGDFMSVDVYNSDYGSSPIFKLAAGQTSCPHEAATVTKYYNPGTVISAATLQREKPNLEVDNAVVYNVPADQAAAFTLTLHNESESEDAQFYGLQVIDATNPDGAVVSMDGSFFDSRREIFVPGGGAITKTITIGRGPFKYDYEDIKVVMLSTCQANPTNDDPIIADTISISAHFLPTCTELTLTSPGNQWVANYQSEDIVPIVIDKFNVNYTGFENIVLRYKPSESSDWIPIETFYRESDDPEVTQIPKNNPVITYYWDVSSLPDGTYDLSAVTSCYVAATEGYVEEHSEVLSGLIDRVNPHPFGNPSPADGVLSPNDEIMIQFNEPINAGILTSSSFDIRGVLNGGALRHEAAVHFDGSEDYMEIPAGINLTRKSFSIDLYFKRDQFGAAVLFSQGSSETGGLKIGFNEDNQLFLNLAGTEISGDRSIVDDEWHHLAVTYNIETQDAEIFLDGLSDYVDNDFVANYKDQGIIHVAQNCVTGDGNFSGYIHELRVWNKALTLAEVNTAATKRMSKTSRGLLANWQMEEAHGSTAQEQVKLLHAQVNGDWQVFPVGNSLAFDGSGFAEADAPAMSAEESFSIEFWINTTDGEATVLSTGKGDGTDSNASGWSIGLDANGAIQVFNNSTSFYLSDESVNDGAWHHVVMSCNRLGNIVGFIDGQEGLSTAAATFTGFSGSKLWIGARGWFSGSVQENDRYFTGNLDEIRIWNTNRSLTQIGQDQYNKLSGEEGALISYFPMEAYVETAGVLLSQESDANHAAASQGQTLVFTGNTNFSGLSPNLKLPRPVEKVNFTYSSNGDRVVLSPTEAGAKIENTILEVTVKNVKDLNGNTLQYPVTWAAYIDRNQVVWLDEEIRLEKDLGEVLTFESRVTNTGGAVANFTIENLPSWLTASPSSGSLEPLSSEFIEFTVNKGLNIGTYNQDIYLRTEFGFDERLELNLKVFQAPPESWQVNPADYQYSMSVIAQVMIEDVLSRDEDVVIAAVVNNEIRGVASLAYINAYDNYQAYLSIYSNEPSGEEVQFYVWNASEGRIHANVTPEFNFESDRRHGSPDAPVVLLVPDYVRKEMKLNQGWQWVSFNLRSGSQSSVNEFLSGYEATEGDVLKGQYVFDQFDPTIGWFGSLTASGGLENNRMYKLKSASNADFVYEGEIPDPADITVEVEEGWNWVGFISQRNMNINEALSAYNASVGDELKSQRDFAVYTGPAYGWLGSLETLVPGEGYLLHAANAGSFVFPKESVLNGRVNEPEYDRLAFTEFELNPYDFSDNMTMIAAIDGTHASGDTLLVFDGDRLVGLGLPVHDPNLDAARYFVTVYGGSTGHYDLSFVGLNSGAVRTLKSEQVLKFTADARLGDLDSPIVLRDVEEDQALGIVNLTLYPNPFTDGFHISGHTAGQATLSVELVSISGKKLGRIIAETPVHGAYRIGWDGKLDSRKIKPGVYFLKVYVGDKVETLRIIKSGH